MTPPSRRCASPAKSHDISKVAVRQRSSPSPAAFRSTRWESSVERRAPSRRPIAGGVRGTVADIVAGITAAHQQDRLPRRAPPESSPTGAHARGGRDIVEAMASTGPTGRHSASRRPSRDPPATEQDGSTTRTWPPACSTVFSGGCAFSDWPRPSLPRWRGRRRAGRSATGPDGRGERRSPGPVVHPALARSSRLWIQLPTRRRRAPCRGSVEPPALTVESWRPHARAYHIRRRLAPLAVLLVLCRRYHLGVAARWRPAQRCAQRRARSSSSGLVAGSRQPQPVHQQFQQSSYELWHISYDFLTN